MIFYLKIPLAFVHCTLYYIGQLKVCIFNHGVHGGFDVSSFALHLQGCGFESHLSGFPLRTPVSSSGLKTRVAG